MSEKFYVVTMAGRKQKKMHCRFICTRQGAAHVVCYNIMQHDDDVVDDQLSDGLNIYQVRSHV